MSAKDKRQQKRKEFKDYINTTLIGGFLVILPFAIAIELLACFRFKSFACFIEFGKCLLGT